MANLNKTGLQSAIQTKIDSLANTASSQTVLQLASTGIANTGVSSSVANVASLPNIYSDNIPVGTMVFVEETQSIYISADNQWIDLEGKLVKSDYNILWSWGDNTSGKLGQGTGTTASKSSPVSVVGGFTDWCQISGGWGHTGAIRTNGTLWTWGCATFGVLGDGTAANKSSPVSVVGGFTDWCQVSAGSVNTAAIRTNGTLWTWGQGSNGKLGDGTTVGKCSPVSVIGGFTDWCQVSVGYQVAAVRRNGTLWSWGSNTYGRLGDGTTVNKSSPVSVVGGFTDWCQVGVGRYHTAAVRLNGTLWTWGKGTYGVLGDGTTVAKSSPISVLGGFTDWCQVASGHKQTVALRTNGTIWSWGTPESLAGALGDGTTVAKSSPVSVIGGFTDWCGVSTTQTTTPSMIAIRTNGTIWTWGRNDSGQLGDGTVVAKCSPVSVIGGKKDWSKVSGGGTGNFAI